MREKTRSESERDTDCDGERESDRERDRLIEKDRQTDGEQIRKECHLWIIKRYTRKKKQLIKMINRK